MTLSRRVLGWFGWGVAGLLLLLVIAFGWIVGTESGLKSALHLARPMLPAAVEIGAVTGRLIGPLRVAQVTFQNESIELAIREGSLNWRPSALLRGRLLVNALDVDGLTVTLLAPPATQVAQPETAFALPESVLAPLPIQIDQLRVTQLRIHQAKQEYYVDRISATVRWVDVELDIPTLQVIAPELDISARLQLTAQDTFPVDVFLEHQIRVPDYAPIAGTVTLSQSLQNPKLLWQVEQPLGLQLDVSIEKLFGESTISAQASLATASLQRLHPPWPPQKITAQMAAAGTLADLKLTAKVAAVDGALYAIRSSLEAQWLDGVLSIQRLALMPQTQPAPLVVSGRVDFDDDMAMDLSVSWDELVAVVTDGESLRSKGDLRLIGLLDDYLVQGTAAVEYLEHRTPVKLTGSGSTESFTLDALDIQLGQGRLLARGGLQWQNTLTGEINLEGTDLDPQLYSRDLQGRFNLTAAVKFNQNSAGELNVQLPEMSLSGNLQQLALEIQGRGRWQDNEFHAQRVAAQWGPNKLSVNGTAGANSNLLWLADVPNLAPVGALFNELWAGSLQGNGRIEGAIAEPQIVADMEGRDLVVGSYSIDSFDLTMDAGSQGAMNVALQMAQLNFAGQKLESLKFTSDGTFVDHKLDLSVDSDQAQLALAARGGWQDDASWQGQLSVLDIAHREFEDSERTHDWSLGESVAVMAGANQFLLETLCLHHQQGPLAGPVISGQNPGQICVQGEQLNGALTMQGTLANVQLSWLQPLLPSALQLSGSTNGTFQFDGELAATQANLVLHDVAIAVRREDQWRDVLAFAPSGISLMPSSEGLELQLELPLRDQTLGQGIHGALSLRNDPALELSSWPLAGSLQLDLQDLSWVAAFSEQLDTLVANINGNLSLAGSLQAPEIIGAAKLHIAQAALPELQVTVANSNLEFESTAEGATVSGTLFSGPGRIDLLGEASWGQGLQIDGSLKGVEFLVSDTPTARVLVSPDLQLAVRDSQIQISGAILIPEADIQLAKVPDGAVVASRDQVILTEAADESAPLDINADVVLELGDKVQFQGLGLGAQFVGSMRIKERSTQVTTATGEVRIVKGSYKAYGQDLTVENGKVIFAGGPIDEPGLDVRAVRQATPEVEVGVQVLGSLRAPTLTVFSSPALPQSDQLAYLVLGRPLSSSSASENSMMQQAAMALGVEGGHLLTERIGQNLGVDTFAIESAPGASNAQAALVVGKYLSPKLYVSYGYGLFEPISTLRLEYQLSRIWRLVTESTNNATGGDFLWVMEK